MMRIEVKLQHPHPLLLKVEVATFHHICAVQCKEDKAKSEKMKDPLMMQVKEVGVEVVVLIVWKIEEIQEIVGVQMMVLEMMVADIHLMIVEVTTRGVVGETVMVEAALGATEVMMEVVTPKEVAGETVMVELVAVVGVTEVILMQEVVLGAMSVVPTGVVSPVVGEVTGIIVTVVMLGGTVEEILLVVPGAIVILVEVIVLEMLGETEIAVKDLHGVVIESQVAAEEMLPDHTKPRAYQENEQYTGSF